MERDEAYRVFNMGIGMAVHHRRRAGESSPRARCPKLSQSGQLAGSDRAEPDVELVG